MLHAVPCGTLDANTKVPNCNLGSILTRSPESRRSTTHPAVEAHWAGVPVQAVVRVGAVPDVCVIASGANTERKLLYNGSAPVAGNVSTIP